MVLKYNYIVVIQRDCSY